MEHKQTPERPTDDAIASGLQDGTYRKWENGTVQDVKTGKIVRGADAEHRLITPETARQFHAMRRQKMVQATLRALATKSGDPDRRSSVAGWEKVMEAQVDIASDPEKGRAATAAAEFIARFLGIFGEKQVQEAQNGPVTVEIPAETALQLAALAAEYRRNVIDVQSRNVE